MYDIGNFLATSLMGTCSDNIHNCPLGSLRYRSDFEPVDTSCFGAGGSYRMAQLEEVSSKRRALEQRIAEATDIGNLAEMYIWWMPWC